MWMLKWPYIVFFISLSITNQLSNQSKSPSPDCTLLEGSPKLVLSKITDESKISSTVASSLEDCTSFCCKESSCDSIYFGGDSSECQLLACFNVAVPCDLQENSESKSQFSFFKVRRTSSNHTEILSSTASANSSGSVSTASISTSPTVKTECEPAQAAKCHEHEVCVVTAESSNGYACNCLSGYFRDQEGSCVGASVSSSVSEVRSAPRENKTSSGRSEITVSLGDDKSLKYPVNSTQIQSTIIPAPVEGKDADQYQYKWTVLSKPNKDESTLDHKDGDDSAFLSNLSPGMYTVKLEVSKGSLSGSDTINIAVHSAGKENQAPVAVVKPNPVKVTLPNSEAILNGADSKDDHEIISYVWSEVKRPSTAEPLAIDNSDPSNQILKLSGLVEGEYVVSLTIADFEGLKDSTNVNITVLPATDYPPTANAGTDQVITLPTNSITLSGNKSTDDNKIVSFKWQNSPESASLSADMTGTKTDTLKLSNLEAGTYTFILEVEDSIGQTDKAQVHVIVEESRDKPPKAVITPEGPVDVYLPDSSVPLDASQSSDDNGISTYSWSLIEKPEGNEAVNIESSNEPVTKLLHLSVEGLYKVKVEVADTAGQISSAELSIVVHPDTNIAPIADAGPDVVTHWPVDILALTGLNSSDDGEIVKWKWARVIDDSSLGVHNTPAAGRVVNESDSKPVLLLSGLIPGSYLYELTVSDVQGVQSTDRVMVEVKNADYILNLVELRLMVPFNVFYSSSLKNTIRNIAVDLDVADEEIIVIEIGENRENGNVFILFYVVDSQLSTIKRGTDVRDLIQQKLNAEPKRYSYDTVLIDTYLCQNNCSNHGTCNSFTKKCECDGFWMENVIGRVLLGSPSNCDWSVLYFVIIAATLLAVVIFFVYILVLYTNIFDRFVRCYSSSSHSRLDRTFAGINNRPDSHKDKNSTAGGIISSAKKLRRRRKRIVNNNEYVEISQLGASRPSLMPNSNSVEINLSSDGGSSDELFVAAKSSSVHNGGGPSFKTNGGQTAMTNGIGLHGQYKT